MIQVFLINTTIVFIVLTISENIVFAIDSLSPLLFHHGITKVCHFLHLIKSMLFIDARVDLILKSNFMQQNVVVLFVYYIGNYMMIKFQNNLNVSNLFSLSLFIMLMITRFIYVQFGVI